MPYELEHEIDLSDAEVRHKALKLPVTDTIDEITSVTGGYVIGTCDKNEELEEK